MAHTVQSVSTTSHATHTSSGGAGEPGNDTRYQTPTPIGHRSTYVGRTGTNIEDEEEEGVQIHGMVGCDLV